MEYINADIDGSRLLADEILESLFRKREVMVTEGEYIAFLEKMLRFTVGTSTAANAVLDAISMNQEIGLNNIKRYTQQIRIIEAEFVKLAEVIRQTNGLGKNKLTLLDQLKTHIDSLQRMYAGALKGFHTLKDDWNEKRDEIDDLKKRAQAGETKKKWNGKWYSLTFQVRETFSLCVEKAPRFASGKKKKKIIMTELSKLCRDSFPEGILGRKCDDKYVGKIFESYLLK